MRSVKSTPEGEPLDSKITNPILDRIRDGQDGFTREQWLQGICEAWYAWRGYLRDGGEMGDLGPIPVDYGFTARTFGDAYEAVEEALDAISHSDLDSTWCPECQIGANAIQEAARVVHLLIVVGAREAVAA